MSESPVIPEEVEKEIDEYISEEQLLGGYISGGSGDSEKLPLVENWFPSENEWHGKTVISPQQAQAVAVAKHLTTVFDEISEYEKFIDGVIDDYMKLLTSVEGVSREQQMQVLMALFGGSMDEEQEAENWMKAAISARESDSNE